MVENDVGDSGPAQILRPHFRQMVNILVHKPVLFLHCHPASAFLSVHRSIPFVTEAARVGAGDFGPSSFVEFVPRARESETRAGCP